jgi:putative ABC transport system permease protein
METILQALSAITQNKLRSGLTLLSIVIGVFAIMVSGILISTIDNLLSTELASLGENSFSFTRRPSVNIGGSNWSKYRNRPLITYDEFQELQSAMPSGVNMAVTSSTGNQKAEAGLNETDNNVEVIGASLGYFDIANKEIAYGRSLLQSDIISGNDYAVVGMDLAFQLFKRIDVLGESFKIGNRRYEIIGVLEYEGPLLGSSRDNLMIIPITNYLQFFLDYWESLDILGKAPDKESFSDILDIAIGSYRGIRELMPWDENNFEIQTNESITEQFASLTGYIQYFGITVGLFSMIVAGIGIMNIMLVIIKERTREIGVRKAMGATPRVITSQFLIETIVLCLVGGLIGIIGSVGIAQLLGLAFDISITIPLDITVLSLLLCTFIGLVFGIFPSRKAAKLDPIEALRYE